jgi:hypothetical protein
LLDPVRRAVVRRNNLEFRFLEKNEMVPQGVSKPRDLILFSSST